MYINKEICSISIKNNRDEKKQDSVNESVPQEKIRIAQQSCVCRGPKQKGKKEEKKKENAGIQAL